MQRSKYAPEFKDEAVKQVIGRAYSVVDVAKRLGIPGSATAHALRAQAQSQIQLPNLSLWHRRSSGLGQTQV